MTLLPASCGSSKGAGPARCYGCRRCQLERLLHSEGLALSLPSRQAASLSVAEFAIAHGPQGIPCAPAKPCRSSCEHRAMHTESIYLLFMCMILCMHDDLHGTASAAAGSFSLFARVHVPSACSYNAAGNLATDAAPVTSATAAPSRQVAGAGPRQASSSMRCSLHDWTSASCAVPEACSQRLHSSCAAQHWTHNCELQAQHSR